MVTRPLSKIHNVLQQYIIYSVYYTVRSSRWVSGKLARDVCEEIGKKYGDVRGEINEEITKKYEMSSMVYGQPAISGQKKNDNTSWVGWETIW